MKDLLVLVADRNMEGVFKGLLSRHRALGIREISYDIIRHPEKDPGCRTKSVEFIRPLRTTYRHALIVFDREGSGSRLASAMEDTNVIEVAISHTDWRDQAKVIVIEPELENWIWVQSPLFDTTFDWDSSTSSIREYLMGQGYMFGTNLKPTRPKEALDAILLKVNSPRSSSKYQDLASRASFRLCSDPAFIRLKNCLINWFGLQL